MEVVETVKRRDVGPAHPFGEGRYDAQCTLGAAPGGVGSPCNRMAIAAPRALPDTSRGAHHGHRPTGALGVMGRPPMSGGRSPGIGPCVLAMTRGRYLCAGNRFAGGRIPNARLPSGSSGCAGGGGCRVTGPRSRGRRGRVSRESKGVERRPAGALRRVGSGALLPSLCATFSRLGGRRRHCGTSLSRTADWMRPRRR